MEFDLFDNYEDELKISDTKIIIRVVSTGRKKNTYLEGLDMPDEQLIIHLQNIKKAKGCNGSLKSRVIHVQGNQLEFIYDYLLKLDIQKESIILKTT